MQLQLMQQQMEDNEKKRKEDELAALKDKYMEVKQEAHDAQMGVIVEIKKNNIYLYHAIKIQWRGKKYLTLCYVTYIFIVLYVQ